MSVGFVEEAGFFEESFGSGLLLSCFVMTGCAGVELLLAEISWHARSRKVVLTNSISFS